MAVRTKRVYDPGGKADGTRVLVMRFWPRGVKKDAVHVWIRELGTSPELIRAWKAAKITFKEFEKRYLAQLQNKQCQTLVRDLANQARNATITLLCSCEEEARCHRGILRRVIEKML